MIEIFVDIPSNVRKFAEVSWNIATAHGKKPKDAATFLQNCLDIAKQNYTEEEVNFVDFYFRTQMEMVKND